MPLLALLLEMEITIASWEFQCIFKQDYLKPKKTLAINIIAVYMQEMLHENDPRYIKGLFTV